MKFTVSLAAELATLNAALDEPGSDIGQGLHQLAADVTGSVPSCAGLNVVVTPDDSSFTLTLLDDGMTAGDVGTSIVLARTDCGDGHDDLGGRDHPLFAFARSVCRPGCRRVVADRTSAHGLSPRCPPRRTAEPGTATPLEAASVINQAIGVSSAAATPPARFWNSIGKPLKMKRTG